MAEAPGNGAGDPLRFGEPLGGGGPDAQGERESVAAQAHGERECVEWCPICRTADLVRASLPPELRGQLEGVQRDALVAMRAMLDHYIDRLDGREQASSRVEDIPIS